MSWQQCGGWLVQTGAVAGLAVLLGATGCSSLGGGLSKDAPLEVKRAAVRDRVNARWDALIKGDFDRAYEFLSPSSRETVSLAVFKARRGPLVWRAMTIESITCEAEACKVELRASYDYPVQGTVMKGVQTPISETWVLDKGAAWLVFL
jgi:hypothetical protein